MKPLEMTVRRALTLIKEFDALVDRFGDDADYTAMTPASYNKVFDAYVPVGMEIKELWDRYKDGSLHKQTIELAANLNMEKLSKKARKEIESGITRISKG